MPALDHGLGTDERRHEERGDVAFRAADLDQVAEAGGGEDRHARAAALEDRVGADGRAVDEPPDVTARDAQRLEPGQKRRALVERLRRDLGDDDAARRFVHRGEVGEGAADIDPGDEHARMIASGTTREAHP